MSSAVGQQHDLWYYLRKHYTPSEELVSVYGHWVEPDEEVALAKYHKRHTHHAIYEVSETRTIDLKVFGQGHMLYFFFLKCMALAFGALSVCISFPQIIIFLSGTWFPSSADVEASTMGNFGLVSSNSGSDNLESLFSADAAINRSQISFTEFGPTKTVVMELAIAQLFRDDADSPPVPMHSLGGSKRGAIIGMSVLDLIGVLGFFIFALFFVVWTRKLADQADSLTVTIRDYSVRVRGLPRDVTEQELKKYFEQYGKVAQVDLAFACAQLIDMVMERRETVAKQERALAVMQRSAQAFPKVDEELEFNMLNYRYDLSLINRAIRNQQRLYGNANVVEAFIVYQEEVGKQHCLEAHPSAWWRRWRRPLEQRFLGKHALLVTAAPEPTDLKFENLECSNKERLLRWAISWCLKFLLLLMGFALVSMAPAIKSKLSSQGGAGDVSECNMYCSYTNVAGVPSLNSSMSMLYKSCYETGVLPNQLSCDKTSICYECFCRMVLTAGMYSNLDYCSPFKAVMAAQIGSQALSVLTIVAVNLLLPYILDFLSEKEQHQTRSTEARSTTRALLIMYFLNTAISITVANTYFPKLRTTLSSSGAGTWLLLGIYPDLTPHWYSEVGHALIYAQIIGIISRVLVVTYDIVVRRLHMKYKWKCLTQRELNHAFDGPEFTLSDKYGEHLGVVFVCMLFSGPMPLLYWTTCLSFVTMYCLEKRYLLKTCRWPITYNADLARFVTSALPFAVLCHLAFATWAYSYIAVPPCVLVSSSIASLLEGFARALSPIWANTNQLSVEQVAARLGQGNAFHMFAAFWICTIALFIFLTLDAWIRFMYPAFRWLYKALLRRGGPRVTPVAPPPKRTSDPLESNPVFGDFSDTTTDSGSVDPDPDRVALALKGSADSQATMSQLGLLGVPEFDIAVRTQLLIGPTSYNMRTVPIYEEAFEDIEQENLEELEALEKKLQDHEEQRGRGSGLKAMKRKALRQRAEALAKEEMTKPVTRAILENHEDVGRRTPQAAEARAEEPEPEAAPPVLEPEGAQQEDAGPEAEPEPGWQVVNEPEGPEKKGKRSSGKKKKKKMSATGAALEGEPGAEAGAGGAAASGGSTRHVRSMASVDDDGVDADVYGRL